jgi:signal transduction histidine kinase
LIRITDDGLGGARVLPDTGLAGLGDRVAAVGGSLVVRSPVGGGTVVEATLPCAS